MKKINDFIYKYLLEPVVETLGILLFGVILLQIFARTFMETPPSWTEEMSRFVFVWFSFLATAVTLRAKQHLGLDYFYLKFNPQFRRIIDYITQGLILAFGVYCAVYGVQLLEIVARRVAPITGWNMRVFYLVMPVMGILFALVALENIEQLIKAPKLPEKEEKV